MFTKFEGLALSTSSTCPEEVILNSQLSVEYSLYTESMLYILSSQAMKCLLTKCFFKVHLALNLSYNLVHRLISPAENQFDLEIVFKVLFVCLSLLNLIV